MGKKILTWVTIITLTVGLLTVGLGFVVDIVKRDNVIVSNKAEIKNLSEEVKSLRRLVTKMNLQLVAISTHLKVKIVEDINDQ